MRLVVLILLNASILKVSEVGRIKTSFPLKTGYGGLSPCSLRRSICLAAFALQNGINKTKMAALKMQEFQLQENQNHKALRNVLQKNTDA